MTKLSRDTLSNKVNSRLRFLYRQNKFLDIPLCRLLCNAMIQPFFDYACNAWYPNLNKNLKMRLQAAQNKCIRFCLKLGDRKKYYSITEKINWLPIHERVNQWILSFIISCGKSNRLFGWNFLDRNENKATSALFVSSQP